jgi:DNA-binding winged helix-turn-helix (wHTH) protein
LPSNLGARCVEVLRVGCAFVETVGTRVRGRFGAFVFDDATRELKSEGRPVPISPKAFELLAVLFHARPRALSKADLRDRLWPDTVVGETSLPRVVGEVRRALGDRPEQASFVRTVQRFGYAFVGDAVVEWEGIGPERAQRAPTMGCSLLWGERIVPLATGANMVGRDPECAVTIPSGLVSRQHARLVVDGDRAVIHDLGSKNGTKVGDRRVDGSVELTDGDEIRIGPALLVFCGPATGSTRTRR